MIPKFKDPIYVTRSTVPPLGRFNKYLEEIWESRILTNNGPFHQRFEKELADYLGVKHISVFANGTLALITALKALKIAGEVITTPFTFAATTHALKWNNITPVFADIEQNYFNLDPHKIEAAITPQTTAILPVHIYGNPCEVDQIKNIAERHNLKVIYDAAHAFGVTKNGESVLNFGDLSILSFHATKVFNTIEGGAIICHDKATKEHVDFLKNFGFVDETVIIESGINGKMNEIQAAYGLLQLEYIDEVIEKRRKVTEVYREQLEGIPGVQVLEKMPDISYNYPYFAILIDETEFGNSRDFVYSELKKYNVFSRRYFYPLISQMTMYRGLPSARRDNLPIAERIAEQVLCLPLYPDLLMEDAATICEIIRTLQMQNLKDKWQ